MDNVPHFGRITERTANPDGSASVVRRDFYRGKERMIERSREDAVDVESEQQAYAVIINGLSSLKGNMTRVDFSVTIDPATCKITRVVTTRTERRRV